MDDRCPGIEPDREDGLIGAAAQRVVVRVGRCGVREVRGQARRDQRVERGGAVLPRRGVAPVVEDPVAELSVPRAQRLATVTLRHRRGDARGPDHPAIAVLQRAPGVEEVQAHDVVTDVDLADPSDLSQPARHHPRVGTDGVDVEVDHGRPASGGRAPRARGFRALVRTRWRSVAVDLLPVRRGRGLPQRQVAGGLGVVTVHIRQPRALGRTAASCELLTRLLIGVGSARSTPRSAPGS